MKRLLGPVFQKALSQFPAVLVTGPRQAGKTTFVLHECVPSFEYVTFDDPLQRDFVRSDPNGFLERYSQKPLILDEVQYVPELFQYLKIRIDRERRKNGRWILTGSQHFQLMKNVTETLAGRIAVLQLLPFSFSEAGVSSLEKTIWNGGYPEAVLNPAARSLWIRSYIQTYVERDVRQLVNIKDLRVFEQFLGLSAAVHSQVFNAASISRDLGISIPTVKAWAGVLDASYVCHMVAPYFKNFGKRITKTSKMFFLDTALVCELTRQPDGDSAVAGALGGALFEGWIMGETLKILSIKGLRPELYFWRSHDGLEVDLLLPIRGKFLPVEIKLTSTPQPKHWQTLERFRSLAGRDVTPRGLLVCRVSRQMELPSEILALPWNEFPGWLHSEL